MVIFSVLATLLFVYLILLVARMVLDWVQVFAREWRPRGVVLVLAELVYTLTDPPLRFLRRVIPPLRLGQVRLDLAFTVLFIGVFVLYGVMSSLAR
ncbi:YggT family protein [Luteimicrobium subarcticum]|uniref:YggT family protein n=1 Tax=Luteimicrobium subarcticum TaxID=620910 RepID=A0A2M8WTR0_9MICO|nr:YggT family protein [Luteimicrobium subarcticum]